MSKMADKELEIKERLKHLAIILFIVVLAILIYAQENYDNRIEQDEINNIETRLQKQENYMHEAQAKIDNLYRRIEK